MNNICKTSFEIPDNRSCVEFIQRKKNFKNELIIETKTMKYATDMIYLQ